MRKTATEILRDLEIRVANLENHMSERRKGIPSFKLAPSIVAQINRYIDKVWGMDSSFCYNKVIDQQQGLDKLYVLIEIGCEDAGITPEYLIVSQNQTRQVLEKIEILSLRNAQRELKSMA